MDMLFFTLHNRCKTNVKPFHMSARWDIVEVEFQHVSKELTLKYIF